MSSSPLRWLKSKPFGTQILVLALILDPLGAVLGYALHPTLGVEPLMGVVYGLVAASFPLSAWVVRHAQRQ